jgi:hypothetical protein
MDPSSGGERWDWSALAVLALGAAVAALGLAGRGASLAQGLAALGFAAGVLLLAWLWRVTYRTRTLRGPGTVRQRVWAGVVFGLWLAAMAVVLWWHWARWDGPRPQPAEPPYQEPAPP